MNVAQISWHLSFSWGNNPGKNLNQETHLTGDWTQARCIRSNDVTPRPECWSQTIWFKILLLVKIVTYFNYPNILEYVFLLSQNILFFRQRAVFVELTNSIGSNNISHLFSCLYWSLHKPLKIQTFILISLLLYELCIIEKNLERQETNKNGRGTEWHLPKTDECVIRPAGEHH